MADELAPYTTSNTPLAAYMLMRGLALLSTVQDKNDSNRRVFVFVDEPERPRYEQEFLDDYGQFWTYWKSIKTVQRKLHE